MQIKLPPIENEQISQGLESFVANFWVDRWDEFGQLRTYMDDKQLDSAREITHDWKGFCEPYGFQSLGILSEELEKASKLGEFEVCKDLLVQMESYLINKKKHLDL